MERILGFEKHFVRYVIDPLHGQIGLTKLEDEVVKTRVFKRLKNIQQLGFVSNIYPGATHKRYEHCIGTLHVTWAMLKRLLKNYSLQKKWNDFDVLNLFSDEVLKSLRLASLLHDLGHGPFSHAFEQAASYIGYRIDHDEITTYLLTYGLPEESLLNLYPDKKLLKLLKRTKKMNSFSMQLQIIPLETRETIIGIYNRDYVMRLSEPEGFNRIRLFLNDILKGDIGSDRIDYLLRDTYFSGLGHRFNFSDLLENLRGMYDTKSDRLLLAIDSMGRNIVEFLMITRYYHYRLIAHHLHNILEETRFKERIKRDFKNASRFFKASMKDDTIERDMSDFEDDLKIVGLWNMGTIGIDHYRFLFYRMASDPLLRKKYTESIKNYIVQNVNKRKGNSKIEAADLFLAFVVEKPHIPILQMYKLEYLIKKDVLEKYSVLLHDHSILIRGLARTYLEDTSLLVFVRKDCLESVYNFTHGTHHFYLDPSIFEDCLSGINTFVLNRYDFLLVALYQILDINKILRGERNAGITGFHNISRRIREFHDSNGLKFYDFDNKLCFDPDFGPFNYARVSGKEESLIDDLFLFDSAGLIEIKTHWVNKTSGGKDFHTDSYLFAPTKISQEVGLKGTVIPLESALRLYPQQFRDSYKL